MKNLILLSFLFIASTLQAQEATAPIVNNNYEDLVPADLDYKKSARINLNKNKKNRSHNRWYDIVDAVQKNYQGVTNLYANRSRNLLWSDSTIMAPFNGSLGVDYGGVWIKSVASYFDPVDPRYNNPLHYSGETHISSSMSYSIDSLFIPFQYTRNISKPNIVDTLIVSVIYGNGTGNGNDLDIRYYGPNTNTSINHGTDTLRVLHGFMDLNPQSNNQFGYLSSSPTHVRTTRVPLTVATANDTSYNGFNHIKIPINLNVPAGYKAAASIVFKSGDTWTPNADTIYISGSFSTPNFNNLRFLAYEEVDGGYQEYIKGVWSQAALMRNDTSWQNRHIPSYAFGNTAYEHQWFQWLVSCLNCGHVGVDGIQQAISKMNIYPNPAKDKTIITFKTIEPLHNVSIDLVNLNGVLVNSTFIGDVQESDNINKEISTGTMASGMYFIKLKADEGQRTEKIVIE